MMIDYNAMFWWVGAVVLIGAELFTGSFYLLMVATGFIAAALSAHMGAGSDLQIVIGAIVAASACGALHWFKSKQAPSVQNKNAKIDNPDLGVQVQVSEWTDHGTAQVSYRGSTWLGRIIDAHKNRSPTPGTYQILAIDGSTLILAPMG